MKTGIVLSGGGARGFAHLGVLAALLEQGIEPEVVSGTSAGAVVGAFYAAGFHPGEILERIIASKFTRHFRFAFQPNGLYRLEELAEVLEKHLGVQTFAELGKKLIINAADLNQGKTVFFWEGDLIHPLLASCCLPFVFCPVNIQGVDYVDGGLLNNLPIEPLLGMCDYVIGVNVSPYPSQKRSPSYSSIIERSVQMAFFSSIEPRIDHCNCYLVPSHVGDHSLFDVKKARQLYQLGYEFTLQQTWIMEHMNRFQQLAMYHPALTA